MNKWPPSNKSFMELLWWFTPTIPELACLRPQRGSASNEEKSGKRCPLRGPSVSLLPLLNPLEVCEPTGNFCPCHSQDHQIPPHLHTESSSITAANTKTSAAGKVLLFLLFLCYPDTSHNSNSSVSKPRSHPHLTSLLSTSSSSSSSSWTSATA